MAIDFNADQNRLGLALLAAAGPSVRPMSFGQRMFMGMNQHDDFLAEKEQREQLRKAREAQLAFQQMQMVQMVQEQAQRKAAQEREDAIDGAYRGAIRTPQQQALSQFGGPTLAAAQAMPGMIPQIDQQALIESLAKVVPRTAFKMLAPKQRKLTTVAPGASLVDESDPTKPVFTAPDRQKEANPNQPFMMIDGKITPNPAYQQYEMAKARAGGTNVTVPVNLGQKGFDNTLKLRGDFRSEPIYKAHQDVQSAYSQITTALKQASPAGDLAGATKLMKILDPGSVVRESELGMAMAASGLLDRVQNYASMVMSGQKLTPTQRADFQKLAESLRSESEKQYNNKRREYEGIATRNGLNVDDVLGPASSGGGGGWSITKVE